VSNALNTLRHKFLAAVTGRNQGALWYRVPDAEPPQDDRKFGERHREKALENLGKTYSHRNKGKARVRTPRPRVIRAPGEE
jgi:hypothetical protein